MPLEFRPNDRQERTQNVGRDEMQHAQNVKVADLVTANSSVALSYYGRNPANIMMASFRINTELNIYNINSMYDSKIPLGTNS